MAKYTDVSTPNSNNIRVSMKGGNPIITQPAGTSKVYNNFNNSNINNGNGGYGNTNSGVYQRGGGQTWGKRERLRN